MITPRIPAVATRAAAICALAALTVSALADVKVISRVQIGMMGQQQQPQKVTIYYKGTMIRTETGNSISIVNSKTHQVTMLNPANKTYTVVNRQLPPEAAKNMKMSATAKVTPTNEKKTIAGKPAKLYKLQAQLDMTSPQMQNGKVRMKVNMDQWTTTAAKSSISPGQLTGSLDSMLSRFGNLASLKQLSNEMAKIKGLPLSSVVNMDMVITMPNGQSQNMTMKMVNDVLQLSEGALPASMFQIPQGYKKSVTPPRAGAGAGAGAGGGRGPRGGG